ncbi:MAG: exodeoxyribonuclease VII small subunit [Gammaproteobacteria bacterium]|nr:exodeoxyribonuclease VII small subunit [Gammaproteobacteria bacterium]
MSMAARKKKTPESDANADVGLPFETLMERLEVLVDQLEIGEMSLEESLGAYEQGVALVRNAQGRLDDMDTRLEELLQDGTTTPLQIDDDEEEA